MLDTVSFRFNQALELKLLAIKDSIKRKIGEWTYNMDFIPNL
jgi:hypothetical protein